MSTSLKPLDDILQPVLQRLSPLTLSRVQLGEASSAVTSEPVRASRAMPEHAIALRSGLAVASLELVGASPQAPVVLATKPHAVLEGSLLPEGCDAVVYPSALTEVGAMLLLSEAATPGMNARLEGQDLIAGAIIVPTGQRMTLEAILACRLAGIAAIEARQPRMSVQLTKTSHSAWIEQRLTALGCVTASDARQSHLVISDASQSTPRVALHPGDTAGIELTPEGAVQIELPARFDGVVAAYAALVLPVVARLAGRDLRVSQRPLNRKISSSIGVTELALLRTTHGGYEPLAVGDLTLSALAQADAVMLIPPAAEGHAAGAIVSAIRLADPFGLEHAEGSP